MTIALIASSAFFVAVEFALISARRHRLEDAASSSVSARAALRNASELSVLLAGSQLGITVCTLALGAVAKPAVHYWLTPLFQTWGAPTWLADVAGFVLALIIVTFLHLVIGEMAPKSWAIAQPEKVATLLALPMRGFMWATRPLIVVLNKAANACLAKVGVDPVDKVDSAQNSAALRQLIEHSARKGALDARYHLKMSGALELESLTVEDIVDRDGELSSVQADATSESIRATARRSGHLRQLVREGGRVIGVVHVRDAVAMEATARELMRPVLSFDRALPAYEALSEMRDAREHIAIVVGDDHPVGLVTLDDILSRLMPVRPDEPDSAFRGGR